MAYVLRKIKKSRWHLDPETNQLSEDGVKKASLDLLPAEGGLSVFLVNDDRSNLDRVAAALAASANYPDNFDFVLLDEMELDNLGIELEKSLGETPDDEVNALHRDLVDLGDEKIRLLVRAFCNNEKPARIREKRIRSLIHQGIAEGHIDRDRVRFKEDSSFWKELP